MATKKAPAKKAPAKKYPTKKKSSAKKSASRAIPDGYEKFTFNFPTKLISKFKQRAKRLKSERKEGEDGRWGYQSFIRETLEKASANF